MSADTSRDLDTPPAPDLFHLHRFISAQQPVYDRVVQELEHGQKTSHWMWFIFPQIEGLGISSTARRYAISSLPEASAYLDHPLLGARLRECTRLVNAIHNRTARAIFGSPDDLKLRSSMTLFAHATTENSDFLKTLRTLFNSEFDPATLAKLRP